MSFMVKIQVIGKVKGGFTGRLDRRNKTTNYRTRPRNML